MPRSSRPPAARRGRTGLLASLLAVAVVAAVVSAMTGGGLLDTLRGLADGDGAAAPADPGGSADRPDAEHAADLLAGIATAEPRPRGDYDRDAFGDGWVDTDDNGCSTRNDVLARDLTEVETAPDCKVLAGVLDDPYTGERITFTAEDPQAVQIDHVVPLSLAWRMGAADWDRDRRVEFANDPANLLATDGPANSAKGDSGPGEWRPHEDAQCAYAVSYIGVSDRYGLPLAAEDHAALDDMLATCA
ncbi:HNH endonuclease family protein [Nocardiopsis trehalosi]|uniref:HNH endonuclease family protein n=1 Tax=Nocardiopsis trehalosi TaxID=109329 RepID=UPI00082F5448|nr:HNH endonuclease family protein [Nocardiopsis trehalosi]